ncbi:methyltransferase family protein [Nocardia sp. NPDC051900]|uniref:methyltransferase family protein n=1 Tax=Nocardia sp. NPDC051900 TaxID=3364326 RepID=UPI003793EE0E
MKKSTAALGSVAWFFLAPGIVAIIFPWLITGWQFDNDVPDLLRIAGVAMASTALATLIHAFGRFVAEGHGTPAPVAPPVHLVIGGPYRYVRNPMYLAVFSIIFGQALIFGNCGLLWYGALVICASVIFVHGVEEPILRNQFGDEFDRYRHNVRAWLPRPRPWYAQPSNPETHR